MTNIFKTKVTKEFMEAADDSSWAPGVAQVPSDIPWAQAPDLWTKQNWPAPTVSVQRPRYGHGNGDIPNDVGLGLPKTGRGRKF